MGKRYYCDYCERSFIDDVESRKKHIKSLNHEILRKVHYNSFRDLKTLVEDERGKVPCKRFRNQGECPFGDNCNYSHYSEGQLRSFEFQIRGEELAKAKAPQLPSVEDWLKKRRSQEKLAPPIIFSENEPVQIYNYHLPPSLIPATKQQILACTFQEWG